MEPTAFVLITARLFSKEIRVESAPPFSIYCWNFSIQLITTQCVWSASFFNAERDTVQWRDGELSKVYYIIKRKWFVPTAKSVSFPMKSLEEYFIKSRVYIIIAFMTLKWPRHGQQTTDWQAAKSWHYFGGLRRKSRPPSVINYRIREIKGVSWIRTRGTPAGVSRPVILHGICITTLRT